MSKNIYFRAAVLLTIWFVLAVALIVFALSGRAQERVAECACKKLPYPQATCVEIHTNVYFEELTGLLNSRIDDVGKFGYKLEKQPDNLYTVFIVRDSPCIEGVTQHGK